MYISFCRKWANSMTFTLASTDLSTLRDNLSVTYVKHNWGFNKVTLCLFSGPMEWKSANPKRDVSSNAKVLYAEECDVFKECVF